MSETEDKEAHGGHDDHAKGHDDHGKAHGKSASKSKSGGITGYLHGFLQGILDSLSKTLRSFVAFAMAMFFLGAIYGHFINDFATRISMDANLLLVVPLILSVLSYYFTEIAAAIFIVLLGLFLLFFL